MFGLLFRVSTNAGNAHLRLLGISVRLLAMADSAFFYPFDVCDLNIMLD